MIKNFPITVICLLIISGIGYSQDETLESNSQIDRINSNWIISYNVGIKRYFFFIDASSIYTAYYPIKFSPFWGVEVKRRFYLSNYLNWRYSYWSGRRNYPEWDIVPDYVDSTALRQEYAFCFGYSHAFTITNYLHLWISEETMIFYTRQQYLIDGNPGLDKMWLWAFCERLGLTYSYKMLGFGFETGYAPAPALLSLPWDYFDKNMYADHNISLGTKVFVRF